MVDETVVRHLKFSFNNFVTIISCIVVTKITDGMIGPELLITEHLLSEAEKKN